MKVKVFSVRADERFVAIRYGDETDRLWANDKLEREIQTFLDQNPEIQIKHVQFSSVAIVPKTTSWDTTYADIAWEIEKSVLLIYETGA